MKTPEPDNRVVDFLYDDLPEAQREEFSAHLKSDEAAASEAQSFATLLKLYRDESEELTPAVAATERLLREAERAHQSLWSRIASGLLPRLVLRPAVGFAMVAVLLIGAGVFYVLSQGPGAGRAPGRAADAAEAPGATEADRTLARGPKSSARAEDTRTVLAEAGASGEKALERAPFRYDGQPAEQQKLPRASARGAGGLRDGFASKQGALASKSAADEDRRVTRGLRGRLSRRPAKAKRRYFSVGGTPRAAPRARPVGRAVAPANSAPQTVNTDAVRKVQQKTLADNKDKERKKLSGPALHNRARKNLAKGQVAVACQMFGTLVRGNRSYSRRADALLGWARCEMARGSYSRAAQLVRQLISEYPKWKKTGNTMLASIKRRQAQAALRAQRVRRVKRRPARPVPRRSPRQTPTSR